MRRKLPGLGVTMIEYQLVSIDIICHSIVNFITFLYGHIIFSLHHNGFQVNDYTWIINECLIITLTTIFPISFTFFINDIRRKVFKWINKMKINKSRKSITKVKTIKK
uniref:7TM GPCR serpentine receptor class x (Srx) domain-containing protein n=1 Tax=Strongyloides stercoralis TaxID=6248 RepID=A0A0K0EQ04_STRER